MSLTDLFRFPPIYVGEIGFAIAVVAAILAYQQPSWDRAICLLSILGILLSTITIAYYITHLIIDVQEELQRSEPAKLYPCVVKIVMIPLHGTWQGEIWPIEPPWRESN